MMLAIVCVAMSKNVYAYDFEVDGIYYNILSSTDLTVAVAPKMERTVWALMVLSMKRLLIIRMPIKV